MEIKIPFDIDKLEVGDTIVYYNGEHVLVEDISKCPCGQCDTYYINYHINTSYGSIQYIIKNKEVCAHEKPIV